MSRRNRMVRVDELHDATYGKPPWWHPWRWRRWRLQRGWRW